MSVLDQKIHTEDALNATHKLLENIVNHLDRFVGTNDKECAGTQLTLSIETDFTQHHRRPNMADKQKKYAENLILVKSALEEIHKMMEESVKNTRLASS